MTGHPGFKKVTKLMQIVHELKNSDYSNGENPFSNLDDCEDMGIPNWIGTTVRLGDKYARLKTGAKKFMKNQEMAVKAEGIGDTFLDNANYSVIAFIQYCEREGLNIDEYCKSILKKMGAEDKWVDD